MRGLAFAAVVVLAGAGAGIASQSGDARRAALPEISIADASVLQYQTGNSTMTFKVTLSAASAGAVTVDYATREPGDLGSQGAEEFEDYLPTSGTLTFAAGETSKTIDVTVVPEPGVPYEADEYFAVDLSSPVGGTIARRTGIGTIVFIPAPKPGSVNLAPVGTGGDQCVKTVDSSVCAPLTGLQQIPITSIQYVDPGHGIVGLEGVEGKGNFYGTPFTLREAKTSGKKKRPVLVLQLVGGNFSSCRTGTKAAAGTRSTTVSIKNKKPVRRLWGHGKGRFRTKGRYSAGTVRGTYWITVDRCDGTLTRVFRGVVSVHDLVLGTYVRVRAGHSYLASPAKKKKK